MKSTHLFLFSDDRGEFSVLDSRIDSALSKKISHNSYSDSNGPLCEDLQDPQQHSCKKLEYIRTSQLFIAGGGGKRRIWGRSQGFPG